MIDGHYVSAMKVDAHLLHGRGIDRDDHVEGVQVYRAHHIELEIDGHDLGQTVQPPSATTVVSGKARYNAYAEPRASGSAFPWRSTTFLPELSF